MGSRGGSKAELSTARPEQWLQQERDFGGKRRQGPLCCHVPWSLEALPGHRASWVNSSCSAYSWKETANPYLEILLIPYSINEFMSYSRVSTEMEKNCLCIPTIFGLKPLNLSWSLKNSQERYIYPCWRLPDRGQVAFPDSLLERDTNRRLPTPAQPSSRATPDNRRVPSQTTMLDISAIILSHQDPSLQLLIDKTFLWQRRPILCGNGSKKPGVWQLASGAAPGTH